MSRAEIEPARIAREWGERERERMAERAKAQCVGYYRGHDCPERPAEPPLLLEKGWNASRTGALCTGCAALLTAGEGQF